MIQRPAPHCFGPGAFFEPAGDFPRSSANDSEQIDPKTKTAFSGNKQKSGYVMCYKGISKNTIGWIFSAWTKRTMQKDLSVAA